MSEEEKTEFFTDCDGDLYCKVNGVNVFEYGVEFLAPELLEAFRAKDEDFGKKMKDYCLKRNQENLNPKVEDYYEAFYKGAVEYLKQIEDVKERRRFLYSFSYDSSSRVRDFMDEGRLDELYEKMKKGLPQRDPRGANPYLQFFLQEKYGVYAHEELYVKILRRELNRENPYPNMEIVRKIKDSFCRSDELFSMHAVKHLFDSIGDRDELLPLAGEMFEKAGKGYLAGRDGAYNFDEVLSSYVNYKEIMAERGTPVEDSEIYRAPEIQGLLAGQKTDLRSNLLHGSGTLCIVGHFVDVDGTLIKDGKLNQPLYEAMLAAKKEGKPVYIFSGEDMKIQTNRLKYLGVDVDSFNFVEKKHLLKCLILGAIVDDTPPFEQGFCTYHYEAWQKPNQTEYHFDMTDFKLIDTKGDDICKGARILSVEELLKEREEVSPKNRPNGYNPHNIGR